MNFFAPNLNNISKLPLQEIIDKNLDFHDLARVIGFVAGNEQNITSSNIAENVSAPLKFTQLVNHMLEKISKTEIGYGSQDEGSSKVFKQYNKIMRQAHHAGQYLQAKAIWFDSRVSMMKNFAADGVTGAVEDISRSMDISKQLNNLMSALNRKFSTPYIIVLGLIGSAVAFAASKSGREQA